MGDFLTEQQEKNRNQGNGKKKEKNWVKQQRPRKKDGWKGFLERAKRENEREGCEEGFGCKSEKAKEDIACISAGASRNPERGFQLPEPCDFQEPLLFRLAAQVFSGNHGSFSTLF